MYIYIYIYTLSLSIRMARTSDVFLMSVMKCFCMWLVPSPAQSITTTCRRGGALYIWAKGALCA